MKNTLVFDVRNIKDGIFNDYEVEVQTTLLDLDLDDVQFIRPVNGNIQLLRHSEDNIYVKAGVFTNIETQCGRCLESFEINIAATFELQFTPVSNPEDVNSDGQENGERYYDGETFDITEDTRQAILIQIPIWPLCSQTCEGLCHGCGVNLNEEQCSCQDTDEADIESETHNVNSPFAELPELLAAGKLQNKHRPKDRKEVTSQNGTSKT